MTKDEAAKALYEPAKKFCYTTSTANYRALRAALELYDSTPAEPSEHTIYEPYCSCDCAELIERISLRAEPSQTVHKQCGGCGYEWDAPSLPDEQCPSCNPAEPSVTVPETWEVFRQKCDNHHTAHLGEVYHVCNAKDRSRGIVHCPCDVGSCPRKPEVKP